MTLQYETSIHRCALLLGCALALSTGCVNPKSVGDLPGESGSGGATTTADTTTETSATETSASSGVGETDGPTSSTSQDTSDDGGSSTGAQACSGNPDFQCTEPFDCGANGCGGPFSPFDEDGCLRNSCVMPGDCGPGQVCFTPMDYGGCASSGVFCEQDGELCQCGSKPDCGGSYCIPEREVPSADCWGEPDEVSCTAAGCNHFETVTVINDDCSCELSTPACVEFIGRIGGAGAPNAFFHLETQTMAVFSADWIEPPLGWGRCSDPGAPVACGCYQPFTEPVCP